jgi:hypothetical protein
LWDGGLITIPFKELPTPLCAIIDNITCCLSFVKGWSYSLDD